MMKLLLTDSGVQNPNTTAALLDRLVKPIAESTALFIPTALHAQKGGAVQPCRLISGR